MSTNKDYDINSKDFTEQQLQTFSPFRVVKIETRKEVSPKTKKEYTRYLVSISPIQNPSVKIGVYMFKNSLDNIRAILTMNPQAGIQAENYTSEGSNRTQTRYSGVNVPTS